MTAKEIILQYNKEYSMNDELLNAVKELVADKCKEQRELCFEAFKKSYEDNDIEEGLWNAIRTAKQPKV